MYRPAFTLLHYRRLSTPTLFYVPATLMLSFATKKLSIGANEDAASPFKFQVATAHGIGHGSLELSSLN